MVYPAEPWLLNLLLCLFFGQTSQQILRWINWINWGHRNGFPLRKAVRGFSTMGFDMGMDQYLLIPFLVG